MIPCLSASRGYKPSPSPSPISTTTCSLLSDASGGSEISSGAFVSRKKPRTRRKRPQQVYNEAAAALSAIYPKIFSHRHRGPHHKVFDLKAWKKIEPLRFKDEGAAALLLQEVPTLIGRVRELHESELLCNEGTPPELKLKAGAGAGAEIGASLKQLSRLLAIDSYDAGKVEVEMESASPSLDDDDSWGNEYDFYLESNNGDIDGGIMSSIMGSDANPDTEEGLGVFGFAQQGTQYSLHSSAAIRALRRSSDSMVCPVFDYSYPRLRLSDKIMEEKEMFFSSLEWLKRDDAQQRLKLKLNYEDVLSAWSDRRPLYTDEVQHPPIVPDDSYIEPMATSMNFDVVPDLGFWMTTGNGLYGQVADGILNGSGVREASVLRYKEKRRTRLFSKKIRYEVRKFNAERRPRMK
ncbi:hypothetical protein KI387_019905, partial [Taxus chinensis]